MAHRFYKLRTRFCSRAVFLCLTVLVLIPNGLQAQDTALSLGIVGDSLALGAGTHPALSLDYKDLWKVMTGQTSLQAEVDSRLKRFGIHDRPEHPQVLWPGIREYYGDTDWVYTNITASFTQTFFNTPQYSWSYLVGRQLSLAPGKILVAAENGARVRQITRQIDRLLDAGQGTLPALILVFFTGNDLCASNMNMLTSSEDFGEAMQLGLEYLARNGQPHPQGTQVLVPHFLSVAQLLSSESILNQPLTAYGEKSTCRELRKNNFQPRNPAIAETLPPEALYLSAFLPPNFASKCPTLFAHNYLAQSQVSFLSHFNAKKKNEEIVHLTKDYLSQIATRIRNYRLQTDKAVQRANDWVAKKTPKANLHFRALPQTAEVIFEGEDMGPDCFHLNINGQIKIADAILKGIETK